MGPYIVDGHYMYGNTFCMPRPPYYNTICHHRAPGFRAFPPRMIADRAGDGVGYSEPEGFSSGDGDCTHVVRSSSLPNITSVTAKKITTLRVKLWGLSTDDDYSVDLEIGNRYAITYLVTGGYSVADGYLEYIDSSISDSCTTYTGNYQEDVVQAYIGLDCSTTGKSDKRKIYISSIRKIEELEADEDYSATVEEDVDSLDTEGLLKKVIYMLNDGLLWMSEDLDGINDSDQDDLEIWDVDDIWMNHEPPKGSRPKTNDYHPYYHNPDEDVDEGESFFIAEGLMEDLDNIIRKCRHMAKNTILVEEIDERKDDGTERAVRRVGDTYAQLNLLATKIYDYDVDLDFNPGNYPEVDSAPRKVKELITRKVTLIIRYVQAISSGFQMVEEVD